MDELAGQGSSPMNEVYQEIAVLIGKARQNVQSSVNYELAMLYWAIGKLIKQEILQNQRAEYGRQVVDLLSNQLTLEYGKGFSRPNLFRMVQFYETFSDEQIVSTLMRQLSWSHFLELISFSDSLKREFYLTMCINERWSVRTLKERIAGMLYERTAISKKPEATIQADLVQLRQDKTMSPNLFFRDPYVLDFLELRDVYSEKDLESAILAELEREIHIAQYLTEMPPKEILERKLREAIYRAQMVLEQME